MKKIAALTVLFSSFFAASYAQLEKIHSSPVYDNTKEEYLLKHVNTPKDMEKYSLMENGQDHNSNVQAVNRTTLIGNKKSDKALYKIDASGYAPNSGPYDIKKVTFPKTDYLMN